MSIIDSAICALILLLFAALFVSIVYLIAILVELYADSHPWQVAGGCISFVFLCLTALLYSVV